MSRGPHPDELSPRESVTVPWRLTLSAPAVDDALAAITRYGWAPAVAGLLVHGIIRGVFEYVSDPFVIIESYVFDGWTIAFAITLLEGVFIVVFAWFTYFGAVGVIAGFISTERIMAPEIFKVGGYLTALFVPAFLVGSAVIATVSGPPELADVTAETVGDVAVQEEAHSFIYDTVQMQVAQTLKAVVWILVGFLLLPVVSQLYGIDEKGSVAAVLPVTLVAVFAAFLV